MGNAALTNDTTPALDWADVSGADKYHAQISRFSDFRSIDKEDNTLATSTYTPTALATDDYKYYWRWRYSTDSGSTWSAWSGNYSFWLKAAFTATRTPTTWEMVAVTPLDLSDRYTFSVYPEHAITPEQILRADRRVLDGSLVVESVGAEKSTITLVHEGAYIQDEQKNEILRFYRKAAGFYLLSAIDNGTEDVENVWKVIFSEPPTFNMVAPGREDLYTSTFSLKEV